MSTGTLWLSIAAAGVLTFALRWSFIALAGVVELPPPLRRALRFVPAAVLSAIICPAVLVQSGEVDLSIGNMRLLAALIAAFVAWRTRNILYTIATGMIALWVLNALTGTAAAYS